MGYMRAAGLTTLLMASLATAALVGFGGWYSSYSGGDFAERVLVWFPISLIGCAPVCLVLFPLIHGLLNLRGKPSGRLFALIGGACGALISGYALFRFRGVLFPNPGIAILAIPVLVIASVVLGFIAGFLFERLARTPPKARIVVPPPPPSNEGRVSAPRETVITEIVPPGPNKDAP